MSGAAGPWQPPAPLTTAHAVADFDSGEPTLDWWLKQRALRNEAQGASRSYVVRANGRVVGYYCLATATLLSAQAPATPRRNMPDPIPAMLLGRLAVDRAWQGQGLGTALLRDAILRTLQVAELVGVKALLVHALSASAVGFYREHGFRQLPAHPHTLFLALSAALPRSTAGQYCAR